MTATTPTVIRYDGDPYLAERAIDRALEGQGWRVVVMFAEDGGVIRIAEHGRSLFDAEALVLRAGWQLVIGGTGAPRIEPIPAAVP